MDVEIGVDGEDRYVLFDMDDCVGFWVVVRVSDLVFNNLYLGIMVDFF